MVGTRMNRVAYPDHVVWQGLRIGRILGNAVLGVAAIGVSVPAFVAAAGDSYGDRTKLLALGTALLAAGGLLVGCVVWRARVHAGRRVVIRPDAVVLVDGAQALPIAWDAIAALRLGLRIGERTDAGVVTLHVTLRDDSVQIRRMAYVEEGMFRALALDLCQGLADRPVQFTVQGPQAVADEVAARMTAGQPPRPSGP